MTLLFEMWQIMFKWICIKTWTFSSYYP